VDTQRYDGYEISRMENIPSDIDFARKLPKAKDDFDQKNE
jgi:hypothetical protein